MNIGVIKEAARLATPRIRPVERSDGEYYVMLMDAEVYWQWTQQAWHDALESAKRQMGKIKYW